jgi:hypothetical protein
LGRNRKLNLTAETLKAQRSKAATKQEKMPGDELVRSSLRRGEMFIAHGPAPRFFTPAGRHVHRGGPWRTIFYFPTTNTNVCLNLSLAQINWQKTCHPLG